MFTGVVTLLDALMIAVASMLVVFTVLLILFGVTLLFPLVFRQRPAPPAPAAGEVPSEDGGELAAVFLAAIQAYRADRRVNPQVRSAGAPRWGVAALIAPNPMARDCLHEKK